MSGTRSKARTDKAESTRQRAKVFWTGRSQAVRLPKEFRFTTSEVTVHKEGERVVLEPVDMARDARGWPLAWWQLAGAYPELDLGDRTRPHERDDVLTSQPVARRR